jgi:NAD(P)-dependent dehydrogenase (short-subunit alcohol dehydrogenase family)
MESKTCIITEASSGVGKAAATELVRRGHRVILACRKIEHAETARQEIGGNSIAAKIDLSQRASIHTFTDWVRHELGAVDVLINNAADFDLFRTERQMTRDGFETVWATNHLGPVLLVDRLMDLLTASSQGRIINISSKGLLMHPFLTVNQQDPMFVKRKYSVQKAYYQSKLAQIMHTLWLAGRLPGTMVTANCIRVSNVKVALERFPDLPLWMKRAYAIKALNSITPEQMAETYVHAALDEDLKNVSGKYFGYPLKEVEIPAYARDPLCIEQVMQISYKQLGIQPAMSFEPGETE